MGLKLFSRILGDGEKHLVILHGLLGSADNWQTLGKRYAEHFTVHLVDARNHGRSPHSSEHSYSLMVEDLLHYLNEKGVSKAHLLGHSMGGKTVMKFAEKYPERVAKLIVADIAPQSYTPHHGPIFDALLKTTPNDAKSREEVQLLVKHVFGLPMSLPSSFSNWSEYSPSVRNPESKTSSSLRPIPSGL